MTDIKWRETYTNLLQYYSGWMLDILLISWSYNIDEGNVHFRVNFHGCTEHESVQH